MVETSCPWCEVELVVEPDIGLADERECPECSTTWSFVAAERELTLAA